MAQWQGKAKRKPSGGRLILSRGKRKTEIGAEKQFTTIGKPRFKKTRSRAGNKKVRVLAGDSANVLDPATGKAFKATIETVVENPCNPNYVQRNIVTKGATIKTDKGLARVTSRPGQHGVINAVLIK
ncbi:MAG: 30S ribosomal protein S8e [Candidatus Thermoplasmatota archaeon]|nr:30S ribosomal protein S8e [Candidatus Thermoplasmatota archaeon]